MRYEVTIIQHRPTDGGCGYDESVFIEFFTLAEALRFANAVIENSDMNTKVTITKKQKEEE